MVTSLWVFAVVWAALCLLSAAVVTDALLRDGNAAARVEANKVTRPSRDPLV